MRYATNSGIRLRRKVGCFQIMEYDKDILRLIEEGQEVSFIEPFLESCLQVSNFYVMIVLSINIKFW